LHLGTICAQNTYNSGRKPDQLSHSGIKKEFGVSSRGKTVGLILVAVGIILAIALGSWLFFAYQEGTIEASGAAFGGAIFAGVLVLPLVGGGLFLMKKGGDEERDLARVREQRKLLDMVKTRGQVAVSDL